METAQFQVIDEAIAPGDPQSSGIHIVDYETQKLLSQGWQRYLSLIRAQVPDIPAPVVRQITTTFEAECRAGDRLARGVRAVSRTRRSYVLDEALWQQDSGTVVATSTVIMTGIDRGTGKAAEIPDEMWSAVEALEGRSIPRSDSGGR